VVEGVETGDTEVGAVVGAVVVGAVVAASGGAVGLGVAAGAQAASMVASIIETTSTLDLLIAFPPHLVLATSSAISYSIKKKSASPYAALKPQLRWL
jgi:hypothetical protein